MLKDLPINTERNAVATSKVAALWGKFDVKCEMHLCRKKAKIASIKGTEIQKYIYYFLFGLRDNLILMKYKIAKLSFCMDCIFSKGSKELF